MSWEVVSCWIESHPGLASWVQAVGAIGSIWFAWVIARSQAKKIEHQATRQDASRCGAVIQLLKHAKATFESNLDMSNNYEKIEKFRVDLNRLIAIFEGIDLFDLPHIELVDAVCVVRQELAGVAIEFAPTTRFTQRDMLAINFRLGRGKKIVDMLNIQIVRSEAALRQVK